MDGLLENGKVNILHLKKIFFKFKIFYWKMGTQNLKKGKILVKKQLIYKTLRLALR